MRRTELTCDRCRRVFAEGASLQAFGMRVEDGELKTFMGSEALAPFDLCADCIEELAAWLKAWK